MRTDTPLRAEPALCMICPAAATPPFREPPRCDDPSFAGSAPRCDDPSFAGFAPLQRSTYRKNKNQSVFATFLRLGAPLRLCKAKKATLQQTTCAFTIQSAVGGSVAIPNRKKVAARANFLFLGPQGQLRGGAIVGIGPVRSYRASPLRRCGGG